MQDIKTKLPMIVIALIFVGLCIFTFYFMVLRTSYFYTQIDNTNVEQLSSGEYNYELRAYDEHGKIRELNFKASKELREDAFLKLEVIAIRGVVFWEEVSYDELPLDVRMRYTAPAT